jgi:hypothetical protein
MKHVKLFYSETKRFLIYCHKSHQCGYFLIQVSLLIITLLKKDPGAVRGSREKEFAFPNQLADSSTESCQRIVDWMLGSGSEWL